MKVKPESQYRHPEGIRDFRTDGMQSQERGPNQRRNVATTAPSARGERISTGDLPRRQAIALVITTSTPVITKFCQESSRH